MKFFSSMCIIMPDSFNLINNLMPYQKNLYVQQASDYSLTLSIPSVDLTGKSLIGYIKKSSGSSQFVEFDFEINDAATANITLLLDATTTATFQDGIYIYDIYSRDENTLDGETKVMYGSVKVSGSATNLYTPANRLPKAYPPSDDLFKKQDLVTDDETDDDSRPVSAGVAKRLRDIIESYDIEGTPLEVSDIVNDLVTGGDEVPLSAEQGLALKNLIDDLAADPDNADTFDPTVWGTRLLGLPEAVSIDSPGTASVGGVFIKDGNDFIRPPYVLEAFVDAMVVEGAGTAVANAIYLRAGDQNGKPKYVRVGSSGPTGGEIAGGTGSYYIADWSLGDLYVTLEDVASPDLVASWTVNAGTAPAPTVRRATLVDSGVTAAVVTWRIVDELGNIIYSNPTNSLTPPSTGWVVGTGSSPAPTLSIPTWGEYINAVNEIKLNTAVQSGDNVSVLTNDSGYIAADPDTGKIDPELLAPLASQAEIEAGTESEIRSMSPLRVAQAIEALVVGVSEIQDVTTNANKLALTDIDSGHMVRVTGEANRVERYLGGAINNDANWLIIGPNTYELIVEDSGLGNMGDYTINGVTVPVFWPEVSVGWVYDGQLIPVVGATVEDSLDGQYLEINGQVFYNNSVPRFSFHDTWLFGTSVSPLRGQVKIMSPYGSN